MSGGLSTSAKPDGDQPLKWLMPWSALEADVAISGSVMRMHMRIQETCAE